MIQTEDAVEVLQAEGESGAETVGFSTFGAQRINDAQKRRCRPTSLRIAWNATFNAPQIANPTPPQYWGTFITLFDGTIIAGARNDGAGSTNVRWEQNSLNYKRSDGAGGNVGFATLASIVAGLPGGLCGFDVFIKTTQTDVVCYLDYYNPYTTLTAQLDIVTGKIPQIGQYTMAGAPAGSPPFAIIRRRPEGYFPNEDGAQVFLTLPYASSNFPIPAGFVNPATVGVPFTTYDTRIVTNIIP